ncbi:MAG: hypothetical protein KDB14_32980 [Planctomycetales bacterium]|nr:hypothetical protein [Planctomycetales bacterium]
MRGEITRYSKSVGYLAEHFADAVCACGGKAFWLLLDEAAGVASRICVACESEAHPIGDSEDFMDEADEEECVCPCGEDVFEVTVGVSLYDGSEDVRWLYFGCRCVACGLTAVYGDWKNEYIGYRELLKRV